MAEIAKILYAKSFIDKMANGINPLDNSPIPEGELLNHVRISRCLFYVSELLEQMAGSAPMMKKRKRKQKFHFLPRRNKSANSITPSTSSPQVKS